jgi:hypothetical protein
MQTGLTKQEIEDFMKGLSQDKSQTAADGNDYTHEFAIMRPYVKEYEVHPSRFKIGNKMHTNNKCLSLGFTFYAISKPLNALATTV